MLDGLSTRLARPVDAASLVVFRVMFGLLASFTAIRFVAYGWVDTLLVTPDFHFTWIPGMPVASAGVLYGLFGIQALAGLSIAWGRWVRPSIMIWLCSFVYVELIDKALYLNHYVLFSLVGLTLVFASTGRVGLRSGAQTVPTWVIWLLRLQFGLVYFWAAIAKINGDWLFRAEPLSTWLGARIDTPWIGSLLAHPDTAVCMSWGGLLYDFSIPFLLLYRPTRRLGFSLVLAFHLVVGALFPIGVFPFVMIAGATLFFDPAWPRRFLAKDCAPNIQSSGPLSRGRTTMWVGVVLCLVLFPARHFLWSGNVNWTERGYRFSWRVLLNEKTGLVDYRVLEPQSGEVWRVLPRLELTPLQHQHMRTQPDMIRDYALHLKRRFTARLGRDVEVYVDSWASLNGRPSQVFIRNDLDITQSLATLRREGWIVPLEH